jgi:hypothetical protein
VFLIGIFRSASVAVTVSVIMPWVIIPSVIAFSISIVLMRVVAKHMAEALRIDAVN